MSKRSAAVTLKSKGLLPADWDLRKKLSAGQKSWLTKQTKKYADVVKRPGEFTTLKLRGRREVKQAKAQGFRTSNSRLLTKGNKVRRHEGRIVVTTTDGEREYFTSDAEGFQDLIVACRKIKLGQNRVWALQLAGNELNDQFRNFDDLLQYYRKVNWQNDSTSDFVTFVLISEDW